MRSLTILIPTYNRPTRLLRLLSIIDAELSNSDNDLVNVLVRDNSPGFETKDAVEASQFALRPWLDYKKNQGNLGFDTNILQLYLEAKGDYVWFIGDDDIIFEGGIKKVLDLVNLNPAILLVPFKQPESLTIPQYQILPPIKYWNDVASIVEQLLKNIKITSYVLKRKDITVDKDALSRLYSASGWMHVILAFEVLIKSNEVQSISISEFLAGSKDKEWQVIEWTPVAYLTSRSFYEHDIFKKFRLGKQLKKFEDTLYFGGIDMTFSVLRGKWSTKVPISEYVSFGVKYPFRSILLYRPLFLLKFISLRLGLTTYFRGSNRLFR